MAILLSDLKILGSATMPDDDTPTDIGGAIAVATKIIFTEASGLFQAVSSAGGDTTQDVTVSYRDNAGTLLDELQTLNGQTPVTFSASMERILKAIKSATTTGDVCVESQTAKRANTAQAGDATTITLDGSASAVDDFYNGMVIRLTGGTGSGQIREIYDYDGTGKIAYVSKAWGTNPNGTTTFRIAEGLVFDKGPSEVTEVRRLFYDALADAPGGSTKTYFDKFFLKNTHGSLDLTDAEVAEIADPSGDVTFALETTLDGTGKNGGGNNRQVAPSGGIGSFDSTTKAVANSGSLSSGSAQGVWAKLTLAAGAAAQKTSWTVRLQGNTVA
jgi:hypothetical protein